MKIKNDSSFATILSSLVILLLVVTAVGFLYIFTDSFTTDLKNFYVKYGNDTIIADRENYDIVIGKEYKFEVINTLDKNENGFVVSITPNEKANFVFKVDGVDTEFMSLDNLVKGFYLVGYENYFVFSANMDLQEILELYFWGQNLTEVPTALNTDIPYFTLSISTKDMTQTININFNLISE